MFLGWSNNPAVGLLLKLGKKSNGIIRGHCIVIDQFGISHNYLKDKFCLNEIIYKNFFTKLVEAQTCDEFHCWIEWSTTLQQSILDAVLILFEIKDCKYCEVTLPLVDEAVGLTSTADEDRLAPILVYIDSAEPIYNEILIRRNFCKSWFTFLCNARPLTVNSLCEILRELHLKQPRKITLEFCKAINPKRSNHEGYRSIFGSCTDFKHAHMVVFF